MTGGIKFIIWPFMRVGAALIFFNSLLQIIVFYFMEKRDLSYKYLIWGLFFLLTPKNLEHFIKFI